MAPSRREHLEALRDILRTQLRDAPPSAVAGIAREFRMTLAELASIGPGVTQPSAEEGSKVDELSARRATRQGTATSAD